MLAYNMPPEVLGVLFVISQDIRAVLHALISIWLTQLDEPRRTCTDYAWYKCNEDHRGLHSESFRCPLRCIT